MDEQTTIARENTIEPKRYITIDLAHDTFGNWVENISATHKDICLDGYFKVVAHSDTPPTGGAL